MPDDQHPMNDGPHLDPRLKEFIERVIVSILVKEYLAQFQETEMRKVPMTEQLNFSSKTSSTRIEAKSKKLSFERFVIGGRGSSGRRDQRS